jgi:hypothetical protein
MAEAIAQAVHKQAANGNTIATQKGDEKLQKPA